MIGESGKEPLTDGRRCAAGEYIIYIDCRVNFVISLMNEKDAAIRNQLIYSDILKFLGET